MGFEDLCNIKLSLSLGCVDKPENFPQFNFQKNSLSSSKCDKFFPFLTLSPSSEVTNQAFRDHLRFRGETQISPPQASSISAISSFSNSFVKRERDVSYEVEVDRVSTKVVDHDQDEEVGARKKLRLSKEQSVVLEDRFKVHSNLNPKQKQELAKRLNLRPRQVEVWFQNRRARIKMKQTEVDCELLKKYCETLTDENRRLRKELQEMKASKLSAPVYMQLPAATLSLCPSCEKLSSAAENPSRVSFTIGARSHIYNPFAKPSAA